ncbi:MAG: transposase [Candidatus Aerophobetes bacterium]|nr:transposase [Candidatus Aerophobetes bacterium]
MSNFRGSLQFKIWKSWQRNKKKGKLPEFDGALILDNRFIKIEKAKTFSFDYWVRMATLNKGHPVLIPIKSYDYANDYFNNWKLVNGGRISQEDNNWFLLLTFEKETPPKKKEGKVIGIDIGIKKLMATSEGTFCGKEIEKLMNKIQAKQQGSKAFKRATKERNYYINKSVKELPYNKIKIIVMENIKDIKKNTKKSRRLRKQFRTKFQRWTYPLLMGRINQLCEINGVHFLTVEPAYTSQTCSKCGFVHKLSRNGEIFKCRNCGYTQDADYNASLNILNLGIAQQHMVAESVKVSQMDICPLN